MKFGGRVSTSATSVKRDFIIKNKIFYDESAKFVTAEDYSFSLKIAKKKGIYTFVNEPLGHHLFHSKSASSKYSKHLKSIKEVLKYHISKIQSFEKNKKLLWDEVKSFYFFKEILFGYNKNSFFKKIIDMIHLFFKHPLNILNYVFYLFVKRVKETIIYFLFKPKNL